MTSLGEVGVINFKTDKPASDLHALYANELAQASLYEEILSSFGKGVWVDQAQGNAIRVRVCEKDEVPTPQDRLSVRKMNAVRTIESEGDGLKSYITICIALLLGRRPICIIDEPEMCLHPPQANSIGQFIGRHGASDGTATFVATHSSNVLRGVVQSAKDVQIIRLERRKKRFVAHLVPPEVLAEALKKPTVRAESILDGIFFESIVVVEADGDRLVYQSVWETLSSELRSDVHFATVGGTGGVVDTCKLYRALRIPVAVIADLDLITDPNLLAAVLKALGGDDEVDDLAGRATEIMAAVMSDPASLTLAAVREALSTILPNGTQWNGEQDITVRRELSRLSRKLDRMRKLKVGGVRRVAERIAGPLSELLTRTKKHGLFLVPLGNLEDWLAGRVPESKENEKWAWANAAALYVQSQGAQHGDVWDFVREVGRYVQDDRIL